MHKIKLKKELATKKKFNVYIDGKDSGFCAVEEFNNGTITRHPFYVDREKKTVSPRLYGNIKSITTKQKKPSVGFSVNENVGFGFTRPDRIDRFMRFLGGLLPDIEEVVFTTRKFAEVNGSKLQLPIKIFQRTLSKTRHLKDSQKSEETHLFLDCASKILPELIDPPEKLMYSPGNLSRFVSKFSSSSFPLSSDDNESLENLYLHSKVSVDVLASAREKINIVYIEDVIGEFEKLLTQKHATKALEERWHKFFKKHAWIFSRIFAFPAVYFGDKLNVGGHSFDGSSDKIVDFVYKNSLTDNIAFIEIKTHATPLMMNSAYRKPDVYAPHSKLSGALVQVMAQKTEFMNNYHALKKGTDIKSLNSACIVISGLSKNLKKGQKTSFELFRSSNKDVHIVPFDELLERIRALLELFKTESK